MALFLPKNTRTQQCVWLIAAFLADKMLCWKKCRK